MTNSTESTPSPHLLLFPFPSSGHIIPIFDLANRLLTHSHSLTITILITPSSLPSIQPLLSTHPANSLQTLVLSLPDSSVLPENSLAAKVRALCSLSPTIVSWFKSHPNPPIAIISDFFLGWTQKLACELNVLRVMFSPSGAAGISVYHSLWRDLPKNPEPENMEFEICLDKLPGAPMYRWWQLSHLYTQGKEGDPDWEFMREGMLANLASWGILLNTFDVLERDHVENMKKEMIGHDRVWAIGPLLPSVDDSSWASKRCGLSSVAADDVTKWLDSKSDCSVVYICFGSRTSLTEKQTVALRDALEYSMVNFIWCDRENQAGDEYKDRVTGRGLIINGWAPQLAILRHRSVAAFVTHCGWNSVLEAVSCAVVMVAWPMGADQFADARLLVDQLGVGLRVNCKGVDNTPDSNELARLLNETVNGNRSLREKMRKLRDAAADAVKEGGSSARDLDSFLTQLCGSKKRIS